MGTFKTHDTDEKYKKKGTNAQYAISNLSLYPDFATAIAELTEAKASNTTITAQLAESQSQLQAETDKVNAKATEIETLNAKLAEAETSAASKAVEILASAGVPAVDVQAGEKNKSNQVTRAEFNNMSDKQKMAFSKNKGTITN